MKNGRIKAGSVVKVHARRCEPGKGLAYETFVGTLSKDCPGNTWDVVDVVHGKTENTVSVYSFSVERY